jgi:chromosome segregation ATPase
MEAVERAAAAERARDRAAQDAVGATREQLRADGRAAALAERLSRAEDLVDAAAAQAGELRDQVAALTATLRARDTALEEERAQRRSLVEDHRTELAARDAALAARRTEHQAELDRIRRNTSYARHQAAAEHAEIVGRLRADLSAAAERRATEHTRQLAELHRQLGAAEHEIEVLRARLSPTLQLRTTGDLPLGRLGRASATRRPSRRSPANPWTHRSWPRAGRPTTREVVSARPRAHGRHAELIGVGHGDRADQR